MVGKMVDEAEPDKLNPIGRYYKEWFYKHVEKYLVNPPNDEMVEYIPFSDYCHRHSRSIFWEIADIIPFGNHWFFRYLFGWLVPPKISLLKLTSTPTIMKLYEEKQCIQDVLVPISHLRASLEMFQEKAKVYPIWLCPMLVRNRPGMMAPADPKRRCEMYVDIGVYGTPGASDWDHVESSRAIETFTRSVHGFQMLYASVYQTREEFRKMLDHTLYDKLRVKYGCEVAFPQVYDKVKHA